MLLYVGLALAILLWGIKILVQRRLTWKPCALTFCLVLLFVYGIVQLISLPGPILQILSPSTAQMNDRLLPTEPEVLPDGKQVRAGSFVAGSSLSLYPEATRVELLRLLAIVLLFLVVRNTVASRASFLRLSVLALVCGIVLALFAIVQSFSSASNHEIYWSFETAGGVFGPFVNRNHFTFYLNLCISLGIGVLLYLLARRGRSSNVLNNPADIWVIAGLILMMSSVFLSLSRGGTISLVLGMILVAGFQWFRNPKQFTLAPWLLVILCALGTLYFFSYASISKRFETVLEKDVEQKENRLPVWHNALAIADDFPIWGTGYGTFTYLEMTERKPGDPNEKNEFCYNEYLESWLDGGIIKLALVVTFLGLLYAHGLRAYARNKDHKTTCALILGGMLGITILACHSCFDYGLHIPAVTVFATVVAAQIAALGAPREMLVSSTDPHKYRESEGSVRFKGLSAVAAALVLAGLAVLLVREGYRLSVAERYRLAARRLEQSETEQGKRTVYLKAAVAVSPNDAKLHLALAEAYRNEFEKLRSPQDVKADKAPSGAAKELLTKSLQHYIRSRNLCPLLDLPHVRLAAYRDFLPKADSRMQYLERATYLRPVDAELWYLLGKVQLKHDRYSKAWTSWKHSLQCSGKFFSNILEESAKHLDAEQASQQVFPDDPKMLFDVAERWVDLPGKKSSSPFLQKALSLLESNTEPDADICYLKAKILRKLNHPKHALESYRRALLLAPGNPNWRMEIAELYLQEKRTKIKL